MVGLVGARQVGKTTLARHLAAQEQGGVTFFDMEDSTDLARLADPRLALDSLDGLVVIDEVQHSEGLFRVLRVLVDRPANRTRFLVLGQRRSEAAEAVFRVACGPHRLPRTDPVRGG